MKGSGKDGHHKGLLRRRMAATAVTASGDDDGPLSLARFGTDERQWLWPWRQQLSLEVQGHRSAAVTVRVQAIPAMKEVPLVKDDDRGDDPVIGSTAQCTTGAGEGLRQ